MITSARPVFLARWLLPLRVRSFSLDGDQVIAEARADRQTISPEAAELQQRMGWFGLYSLVLLTGDREYRLCWVGQTQADSFRTEFYRLKGRQGFARRFADHWPVVLRAYEEWEALLHADRYVADSEVQDWVHRNAKKAVLPEDHEADLVQRLPPEQRRAVEILTVVLRNPRHVVDKQNAMFVQDEGHRFKDLFDTIEKHPLTDEQRDAVLHDEDNSLVIAGAGSGKTSTIIAKVAYLLQRALASPEQILMLAFTHKAADEMRERIEQKLGKNIVVSTFHKLGMDILASAHGRKPSLAKTAGDEKAKQAVMAEHVQDAMKDPAFVEKVCQFAGSPDSDYRPLWDFKTEQEYRDHLLDVEPRTLKGELTASYEECEIANWLTLRGIRYKYEVQYEVDTATQQRRQYQPDFFLPDHGIYIEHWGVDRDGKAAPFMDNQRYQEKMLWARETHARNGTTLVETYSWERMEGVLLSNLEAKLLEKGVRIGALAKIEALSQLRAGDAVSPLEKLLGSFLSLFKSGGFTVDTLHGKAGEGVAAWRMRVFLDIFDGVHQRYQARLRESGEIDFDDMISGARDCVLAGRYRSAFRYIIVDEFQDIALGRAQLIRALREQVPGCKLFCVGDDWQSIYRFTGSDVSMMTQFGSHFGFTKTTRLTMTFRFNDRIAAFSSRFVMKNPSQSKKDLRTHAKVGAPAVTMHRAQGDDDPIPEILQTIDSSQPATVFILNRYGFQSQPSAIDGYRRMYPSLTIDAHTAHGSKGLEADFVIVDNLCGGRFGFPSCVDDDPVLNLVLAVPDPYEHGEERRLFYVAVTRARKHVHLIARGDAESVFVREILADPGYEACAPAGERAGNADARVCPVCGRGQMRPAGKGGVGFVYYACSNAPICRHVEPGCQNRCCDSGFLARKGGGLVACDGCGKVWHLCPKCGIGVMVPRHPKAGGPMFFGCSMFGVGEIPCSHTQPGQSKGLGHSGYRAPT